MIFFPKIKSYGDKNHSWPQILIIVAVSASALTCGILFAWTSPSIPILISNSSEIEPLSIEDCSYFGVIPPLGVILSAPFILILGNFFGNKVMIMILSIPHTLAWILIILGKSRWEFFVSRFLTGVGEAVLFFSVPAYIGEISTPEVRGNWGSTPTLLFFSGHFLINLVGSYFKITTTAYIFIGFPFVLSVIIWFLPESPYYYLRKRDLNNVKRSLQLLRWRDNVDEEITALSENVLQKPVTFKDVFVIRKNRLGLFVGIGTRSLQNFCGFPAIVYFNQFIFNEAGTSLSASDSSIIYSFLQVVLLVLFSFYSEKLGRRRALILSAIGCALSLSIESVYFFLYQKLQLDVSNFKWLPLCGLIMFAITFSFGLCSVPTLMLGEIIDASVKSQSLSIINVAYAISILLCTKLFHVLSSSIGMYAPFLFYTICCLVGLVYVYFLVPETKGKTLYEIQQHFENTKSVAKKEDISEN